MRRLQHLPGSKRKASEDTSQSVPRPRSVSPSSSLSTEESSDNSFTRAFDEEYGLTYDSDGEEIGGFELDERGKQIASIADSLPYDGIMMLLFERGKLIAKSGGFDPIERGKLIASIANSLPCHGIMLLLFETPSGFALCTFSGAYCHLPDSVDYIWAEFGDSCRAAMIVYPKGILSFEDKSRAITDVGVDKQLVDMITKWHRPGMKLCVGKPEYKRIIESFLGIPCMYCETVMEIMWGLQQQLHALMPKEKPKLTKEDRLPMSQGLMRFLWKRGCNVSPEMVNEQIFKAACALFHCDVDDMKNLGLLRDAGLSIRHISGIACEDWDILKLALAVKVIRCPEELTGLHKVLPEDVVSKLKGDACKYNGNPFKTYWFRASDAVVSNHHLRIAKKKLLESLVNKAQKAYVNKAQKAFEAKQAQVEKIKRNNPNYLYPTNLVGGGLRRSARLNPNM